MKQDFIVIDNTYIFDFSNHRKVIYNIQNDASIYLVFMAISFDPLSSELNEDKFIKLHCINNYAYVIMFWYFM